MGRVGARDRDWLCGHIRHRLPQAPRAGVCVRVRVGVWACACVCARACVY
jgi:hypothetical protein